MFINTELPFMCHQNAAIIVKTWVVLLSTHDFTSTWSVEDLLFWLARCNFVVFVNNITPLCSCGLKHGWFVNGSDSNVCLDRRESGLPLFIHPTMMILITALPMMALPMMEYLRAPQPPPTTVPLQYNSATFDNSIQQQCHPHNDSALCGQHPLTMPRLYLL